MQQRKAIVTIITFPVGATTAHGCKHGTDRVRTQGQIQDSRDSAHKLSQPFSKGIYAATVQNNTYRCILPAKKVKIEAGDEDE
jgi:hypothetical protein